jgi:hypothetical protein
MTQIIAALTPDYVLLASDRQLTAVHGAHKGQRVHDDTCKLVSVCNIFGIGYTGWAEVGGKPTHEWIALQPAEVGCVDPGDTAARLASAAAAALASPLKPSSNLSFWLVGCRSKPVDCGRTCGLLRIPSIQPEKQFNRPAACSTFTAFQART